MKTTTGISVGSPFGALSFTAMNFAQGPLVNHRQKQTFRATEQEVATPALAALYGKIVGGGSVHFTANFWRFHEIDFIEASKKGVPAGTGMADWPITYADLEPYYTKVDWEVGISGQVGTNPFEPHHSKPYPVPPMPVKSSGVLFERGARKLGYHPFPAPLAVLSQPHNNRNACMNYGEARAFEPFDRLAQERESRGKSLPQLLDEFASARARNLEELRNMNLSPQDLQRRGLHPSLGPVTLSQLLATWATHDLTHLHQLSRVLAYQYHDAVGPWAAYLGVLQCNGHSS